MIKREKDFEKYGVREDQIRTFVVLALTFVINHYSKKQDLTSRK